MLHVYLEYETLWDNDETSYWAASMQTAVNNFSLIDPWGTKTYRAFVKHPVCFPLILMDPRAYEYHCKPVLWCSLKPFMCKHIARRTILKLLQYNSITRVFPIHRTLLILYCDARQRFKKSLLAFKRIRSVCLSGCTHQCGQTYKMQCADGSGSRISLPMWINGHRLETQTPFYLGW